MVSTANPTSNLPKKSTTRRFPPRRQTCPVEAACRSITSPPNSNSRWPISNISNSSNRVSAASIQCHLNECPINTNLPHERCRSQRHHDFFGSREAGKGKSNGCCCRLATGSRRHLMKQVLGVLGKLSPFHNHLIDRSTPSSFLSYIYRRTIQTFHLGGRGRWDQGIQLLDHRTGRIGIYPTKDGPSFLFCTSIFLYYC